MLAAVQVFRPVWWQALMARGPLLLLLGCAGMAASLALDFTSQAGAMFGFPLLSASLVCLLAALLGNAMAHWRWPGARVVATLAFCSYLTQRQAIHGVDQYAGAWLDETPLLALAVKLAAVLAAAVVLHVLVERPALARSKTMRPRPAPPSAAAAPCLPGAPETPPR